MGLVSLLPLLLLLQSPGNSSPRPDTVPLPPGHKRFGTPITHADMLPGWETFPEDIPADRNCERIEKPMIQPVPVGTRQRAVNQLLSASIIPLSERQVADLLGLPTTRGRSVATAILDKYVADLREQRRLELEEQKGSWGADLEDELQRLTKKPPTQGSQSLKPYLVRAVTKWEGAWMEAGLCGSRLHVVTVSFGYTIPPTIRLPTIVFLPKPPSRVIAVAMFGW